MAIRCRGLRALVVESLKILPDSSEAGQLSGQNWWAWLLWNNHWTSSEVCAVGKKAYSTRSAAGGRALARHEKRSVAESRCNNGFSG